MKHEVSPVVQGTSRRNGCDPPGSGLAWGYVSPEAIEAGETLLDGVAGMLYSSSFVKAAPKGKRAGRGRVSAKILAFIPGPGAIQT